MSESRSSFTQQLFKLIDRAEMILLGALSIALILYTTSFKSEILLNLSLKGLAVLFFLSAYRPIQIERKEGEKLGFMDLLCTTIVPKILWISSAVITVGIILFFSNTGNEGYKIILMLGSITIPVGIILLAAGLSSGVKQLNVIVPILYRAIPLTIVAIYILNAS